MFLLALQLGSEDYGWNSAKVIGLFCGAGVAAVVFVFWGRRMGENAMIPLSVIRQQIVWSSALNFAFLMILIIVGSNFIPIFLQLVKGLSPTMSGVYMLATIVPQFFLIPISGALVSKLGYYIPWALLAAAGTTIGTGLITTWDVSSKLGELLGYQVLLGFRGAGFQMGIIAIQNTLSPSQSAVGTSILVFAQNFLGTIFITIANIVFQETLTREISSIPGGSPEAAIAAGGSAEAVRALAPAGPIRDGILQAYSNAFGNVVFLNIATCGIGFFVAFGMGWVDLRTKPQAPKGEA